MLLIADKQHRARRRSAAPSAADLGVASELAGGRCGDTTGSGDNGPTGGAHGAMGVATSAMAGDGGHWAMSGGGGSLRPQCC